MTGAPGGDGVRVAVAGAAAVVRVEAAPVCSGRDRLATLRVVEAVVESARTGRPVGLRGTDRSRPRLEGSPPT